MHEMQTQYTDENSVCQSVERVDYDKTAERFAIFLHHTKDHSAQFSEKKNGWWG